MRYWFYISIATLLFGIFVTPVRAADAPTTQPSFHISISTDSNYKSEFDKLAISTVQDIDYSWLLTKPTERSLRIDAYKRTARANGGVATVEFSPARLARTPSPAGKSEVLAKDFSPEDKNYVHDMFEVTIATITLNEKGEEQARKIDRQFWGMVTEDPSFLDLIVNMQPDPPAGRDEWELVKGWSEDAGKNHRGKILIKRQPAQKDGEHFKIAGKVQTGDVVKDDKESESATIEVEGEMVFDKTTGLWIAGTVKLNGHISTKRNGEETQSIESHISVETKRNPAK